MESTIAAYEDAYRDATTEVTERTERLSHEQFNWKPSPDSWSVAECLVHLNRLNGPYVAIMQHALEQSRRNGAEPFRYGPVARYFIASVGPEVNRKTRTFSQMEPTKGTDHQAAEVLDAFRSINDGFLHVLAHAGRERLDLGRIRIRSPFLPILWLPVGAFLEALAGHEHRHLDQARRVTEHPGFPA